METDSSFDRLLLHRKLLRIDILTLILKSLPVLTSS